MCFVSCFFYCQFWKWIINLSISIIATSVHPTIINFEWVINFSIFIVETSVPSNEPFVIILYPEASMILNFVWLPQISLQNIMYQFHKVVSSTMFILLKHSSRNYFLILIYFFLESYLWNCILTTYIQSWKLLFGVNIFCDGKWIPIIFYSLLSHHNLISFLD